MEISPILRDNSEMMRDKTYFSIIQ